MPLAAPCGRECYHLCNVVVSRQSAFWPNNTKSGLAGDYLNLRFGLVRMIDERHSGRRLDPLPFTWRDAEGPVFGAIHRPPSRDMEFTVRIDLCEGDGSGLGELIVRPNLFSRIRLTSFIVLSHRCKRSRGLLSGRSGDLERPWPAAVAFDHLVDLGHDAAGFSQGCDHAAVVEGGPQGSR